MDCRAANPSGGEFTSNFTVVVQDKLQPSLHLPSTITVQAASSQGAFVHYDISASDPIYPTDQLTTSCTPESGSLFPIGISVVSCSVTNPLGTTEYGTFNVRVRNAGDEIGDLIKHIGTLHLQRKVQEQLVNQLKSALSAFEASKSNTGKVHDLLNGFISMAEKLRGKGLTATQAAQLIATVKHIETLLE